MTYEQALEKAKQTAILNNRPFIVVQVIYGNGESGWDVTPFQTPAASLGRLGGSQTSRAKSLAARRNGRMGGRPKTSK